MSNTNMTHKTPSVKRAGTAAKKGQPTRSQSCVLLLLFIFVFVLPLHSPFAFLIWYSVRINPENQQLTQRQTMLKCFLVRPGSTSFLSCRRRRCALSHRSRRNGTKWVKRTFFGLAYVSIMWWRVGTCMPQKVCSSTCFVLLIFLSHY